MSNERQPLLHQQQAGRSAADTPSRDHSTERKQAVLPTDLPLWQRTVIIAGNFWGVFIGAVDTTVCSALVAPISTDLNAFRESSWLGTSFLLANITFTPLYGRLCDIIGRRAATALSVGLFTAGTAACAFAPTMKWLIVARFIAGAGGGGINTTSSIITSDLFPLKQRGLVNSASGVVWAVGSALGGPVGGFVSDKFGWRAAFSLQVPLLLIAFVSGLTTINYHVPGEARQGETFKEKIKRIDFLGCGLILLTFSSFLALLSLTQNEQLPWSNLWVVVSAVLTPLFGALFFYVEAKISPEPVLPMTMLTERTPVLVLALTTFVAIANFGVMYSLPLWFIAVKGSSAGEAGSHLIPTSISGVVGGVAAGVILHRTGVFWLPSIIAGIVAVVGLYLIYSLNVTSPEVLQWGAIAPVGFGFMFMLNSSFVALLASIPEAAITAATGSLWLFRSAGQIFGVAATGGIFQAVLLPALTSRLSSEPHHRRLIESIRSDSSIIADLPPHVAALARDAFAAALKAVFGFCLLFAVAALLSFWFIPPLKVDDGELKEISRELDEEVAAQSEIIIR